MAYYGKLPIVLLSELAAGKEDSTNCRIASYLLGRMGERISVEEIARHCFVSKSAVSRFCRDIGLEDFSELKDLLNAAEKTFELVGGDLAPHEQATAFARLAAESMELAARTLDYRALDRLAEDVRQAKRVACFGLLKAETAALSLQSDLVMLGKNAVTKVAFREQMEFLASATEEDVVLIFSYKGLYFDYDLPRGLLNGKPGLWIITGSPEAEENLRKAGVPYTGVLRFESRQDFVSHPYQLMAVAGVISQRVGRA